MSGFAVNYIQGFKRIAGYEVGEGGRRKPIGPAGSGHSNPGECSVRDLLERSRQILRHRAVRVFINPVEDPAQLAFRRCNRAQGSQRLAPKRQRRVPQHVREQARYQSLAPQLEEFASRVCPVRTAADPLDDRSDIGFRQRRGGIDPVKDIEPTRRRMVGTQDENPVLSRCRAASSIDPSSAAGSSTTTEPVQVNRVETALVVLNEPEPAMTSECVDPSTQGSISSGARPPWPHVAGFLSAHRAWPWLSVVPRFGGTTGCRRADCAAASSP